MLRLSNFFPFDLDFSAYAPAETGLLSSGEHPGARARADSADYLLTFLTPPIGSSKRVNFHNITEGDALTSTISQIIATFFVDDGFFNCNVTDFVEQSFSTRIRSYNSKARQGSPVNGIYPAIDIMVPNSDTT